MKYSCTDFKLLFSSHLPSTPHTMPSLHLPHRYNFKNDFPKVSVLKTFTSRERNKKKMLPLICFYFSHYPSALPLFSL